MNFKNWLEDVNYQGFEKDKQRKYLMLYKKVMHGTPPPRYAPWAKTINQIEDFMSKGQVEMIVRLLIMQEIFGESSGMIDVIQGQEASILDYIQGLLNNPKEIYQQIRTEVDPFKLSVILSRAHRADIPRLVKELEDSNWHYLNGNGKIQYI